VAPIIADFWERAEFPFQLLPGLGKLNIASSVVKGYGCPGLSVVGAAMAAVETARVDGSISTFILVHGSLCCLTIGAFLQFHKTMQSALCQIFQPGPWETYLSVGFCALLEAHCQLSISGGTLSAVTFILVHGSYADNSCASATPWDQKISTPPSQPRNPAKSRRCVTSARP